jgi:flagellar hook-associated protein 2
MPIGSVSSGNLESAVQRLLALERRTLDQLTAQRDALRARKSIFSELAAKLGAFQSLASRLAARGGTSPLYAFTADSSDPTRLAVTAGPNAREGTANVVVSSVAMAHTLASRELELAESSIATGHYTFLVTVDGQETEIEVAVETGDTNQAVLDRVAAAIAGAGAGLWASRVTTDTGEGRLLVQSRQTGTRYIVSEVRDKSGDLMHQLRLEGRSGPQRYSAATTQQAADAVIRVNGVTVRSSSNTITDALPGVTLSVRGSTPTTSGAGVSVTVAGDRDGIKAAIEELVSTYNAALVEVRSRLAGDLRGQLALQNLVLELRRATSLRVGSAPAGQPSTLLELGITINRDGSLALSNAGQLERAVSAGVDVMAQVFNREDGVATRLEGMVRRFLASGGPLGLLERAELPLLALIGGTPGSSTRRTVSLSASR